MNIRFIVSSILIMLALMLLICTVSARRQSKGIGRAVAWLDAALILPLIGGIITVNPETAAAASAGTYIFSIGMNGVMIALMNFASAYCKIAGRESRHKVPAAIYVFLAADTLQLLLNTVFRHAFAVEPSYIPGEPYYTAIPLTGLYIHRIADYVIYGAVIAIFIVMSVRTPRIYREKYTIILFSMIFTGVWQMFYIFSSSSIDCSTIGFGLLGILVYYFSILYRPLRLLDRMLSNIVSEMPEAMFVYDPAGKCVWANDNGREITGLSIWDLEYTNSRLNDIFGEAYGGIRENGIFNTEIETADGRKYYTFEKRSVSDEKNGFVGTVLSIRDNTDEQLRMQKELYSATHDLLTGLYTKEYLYQCIRKYIDNHPSVRCIAVFIDVKNFKIVNDVFGRSFGDHAICCIADMLRSEISEKCICGRLAGDTFGIFAPETEFNAERIEEVLSAFTVRDGMTEHRVLIHLGIYEITEPGLEISVMFDRAHLALSTINDQYNTHISYYDNKIRDSVLWNQKISAELENAINEMQIRPYLQPIADSSGNIVGAEALARWIHPEYGFMSPASFIPVFEKNGIIVDVDRHIWKCACEILSRWDNDMFISVNISPKDFYYTDVAEDIRTLVRDYNIEPSRLRIEITESVMMSDADERMKVLDEFRKSGFIVEMDDFGSGFSSLNLLKTMPVDILKIDMMFLSKSDRNNRSETIIRNIIRLSNELGIATLTEGVETEENYRLLSEMGCDLFQGYYFSKPLPAEDFEKKYLRDGGTV